MANIPIERKSGGTPWWLWLLGALLLLGILLFAIRGCDDNNPATEDGLVEDTTAADPNAGIDPNNPAGLGTAFSTVDDVFADTTNLAAMVGRDVTLTDVPVQGVAGDSTFYVTAANGQRLLVVLEGLGESESGPGDGSDGAQNINDGDRLNLTGRLERLDDGARYGLAGADLDRVGRQGIYLRARRVSQQ